MEIPLNPVEFSLESSGNSSGITHFQWKKVPFIPVESSGIPLEYHWNIVESSGNSTESSRISTRFQWKFQWNNHFPVEKSAFYSTGIPVEFQWNSTGFQWNSTAFFSRAVLFCAQID